MSVPINTEQTKETNTWSTQIKSVASQVSSAFGHAWTFLKSHKSEVSEAGKQGLSDANNFLDTQGDRIYLVSKIFNAVQAPFFLIGAAAGYFMTHPDNSEGSQSLMEKYCPESKNKGALGSGMILSSFLLPIISPIVSGALAMNDFKHMVKNNPETGDKINQIGTIGTRVIDKGINLTK